MYLLNINISLFFPLSYYLLIDFYHRPVLLCAYRKEEDMRAKLKAARKAKGLTQQAAADALGIGLRHYQKIERGDTNGSFEIWDALEDILEIHQRILRENADNHPSPKGNRLER